MTKQQYLDIIPLQKDDKMFMMKIAMKAIEQLPDNMRDEFIHRYYLKHIHEGKIIKLTSVKNGSYRFFETNGQVLRYILKYYPKATPSVVYRVAKHNQENPHDLHTCYSYIPQYLSKEEL